MKNLVQFLYESQSNDKKLRYQLEKELRDNNKEKINYGFTDSSNGWLLTFIGDVNENDTEFISKCWDLINKTLISGDEFKKHNLMQYKKINKYKRPILYIAQKDYMISIKKDLE